MLIMCLLAEESRMNDVVDVLHLCGFQCLYWCSPWHQRNWISFPIICVNPGIGSVLMFALRICFTCCLLSVGCVFFFLDRNITCLNSLLTSHPNSKVLSYVCLFSFLFSEQFLRSQDIKNYNGFPFQLLIYRLQKTETNITLWLMTR